MLTVDMLYEQKFGDLSSQPSSGIHKRKGCGLSNKLTYAMAKQPKFMHQGQLLYDQMVGFGKPALAIRFEQNKNKDYAS
jgi:hypothetical protein